MRLLRRMQPSRPHCWGPLLRPIRITSSILSTDGMPGAGAAVREPKENGSWGPSSIRGLWWSIIRSRDVIYVGANDGMLHAFDDATGNELWGFIPPDLLSNLKNFNNQLASLQIFVDGSPKASLTYELE